MGGFWNYMGLGEKICMTISTIILVISIIILIFLICVVANDISYGETEGVVINKEYSQPRTTTGLVSAGKMLVPTRRHRSEKWMILIKKEVDGKEKIRWVNIDKETYNELKIGDYFSFK